MIKGQVGGRLRVPRSAIPEMPDDLILRRDVAQGVAAGTETPVQWNTVAFDRYRLFDPANPSLIRCPPGATFAEVTSWTIQWAGAPGATHFFRLSTLQAGVQIETWYNRLQGNSNESARCIGFPDVPVIGGITDLVLKVYHDTTVNLAFSQVSIRFGATR